MRSTPEPDQSLAGRTLSNQDSKRTLLGQLPGHVYPPGHETTDRLEEFVGALALEPTVGQVDQGAFAVDSAPETDHRLAPGPTSGAEFHTVAVRHGRRRLQHRLDQGRVDPRDPLQRVHDQPLLPVALQILGQGHPCTADAVRLMWAWGGPALGRGLLEAHGLGFHEPWLDVLHPGPHPISGHASLDEPDAAFVTPDPTAPGDQPVDRNKSFVANGDNPHILCLPYGRIPYLGLFA